jgi:hypothetical protein
MKRGFKEKITSSSSLMFFIQNSFNINQNYFFNFKAIPLSLVNKNTQPNHVFNYSDFKFDPHSTVLEIVSPQARQRLNSLFDFNVTNQPSLQIYLKDAPQKLQILNITPTENSSLLKLNKSTL